MTSLLDFLRLTLHHSTASTAPNSSNCFLKETVQYNIKPSVIMYSNLSTWYNMLHLTSISRSYMGGSLLQTSSTLKNSLGFNLPSERAAARALDSKEHLVRNSSCCQITPVWARVDFAFPNLNLEKHQDLGFVPKLITN